MSKSNLTRLVAGLRVGRVVETEGSVLEIHFTEGSTLILTPGEGEVVATFQESDRHVPGDDPSERPTTRQREYLEFIERYVARYGVPPAESDIQRHFLVSAPSVNQMVKTLERRGFVTRQRDLLGRVVPRTIRVVHRL